MSNKSTACRYYQEQYELFDLIVLYLILFFVRIDAKQNLEERDANVKPS